MFAFDAVCCIPSFVLTFFFFFFTFHFYRFRKTFPSNLTWQREIERERERKRTGAFVEMQAKMKTFAKQILGKNGIELKLLFEFSSANA